MNTDTYDCKQFVEVFPKFSRHAAHSVLKVFHLFAREQFEMPPQLLFRHAPGICCSDGQKENLEKIESGIPSSSSCQIPISLDKNKVD